MRLGSHVACFEAHGIPMLGNLRTGSVMGLTAEGARLCRLMGACDVPESEVPASCTELVEHLLRGGYLAESSDAGVETVAVDSAYLHVTQRCNLSCAFCYSRDEMRNVAADPAFDQLRHAVRLLAELGVGRLVLSGGEPFLRHDLAEIAGMAREAGIGSVVVLTNGLLCTRERIEPLVGTVDCVAVAFDGIEADGVAHLRGRQLYPQLVGAVETIVSCGMPARMLPTVHACNLADIPRYRELASSLGATVGFSLLTAPTAALGPFTPSREQLHELGCSAACEQLSVGDDASVTGGLSIAARSSCGAGVRTLSVAADGRLYPCHMLHQPELALGDAFEDDAAGVRRSMLAHACASLVVTQVEGCGECAYRYLCGGGCRARAFMDTGSLGGADPYCELYRAYYSTCLAALVARIGA